MAAKRTTTKKQRLAAAKKELRQHAREAKRLIALGAPDAVVAAFLILSTWLFEQQAGAR